MKVLGFIYFIGVIFCGYYAVCLTGMFVLSLCNTPWGGNFPKYPTPVFGGLVLLMGVVNMNTIYLFMNRAEKFKKIVICIDYLLGLVSFICFVVGLARTYDHTNLGLAGLGWGLMAGIMRSLIYLKDVLAGDNQIVHKTGDEAEKN